ncbi:MAG: hypothetical protein K2N48_04775 [Muribaculaceae bacterium]|nr:hypothetical protein [Muribaculaceae bacterium]
MANSIFGRAMYSGTQSRQRRGRVDLLSQDVAKELNTYRNFGIFHTYNDIYADHWDKETGELSGSTKIGTPGVRSIFNKLSTVVTGTNGSFPDKMGDAIGQLVVEAKPGRISKNVPLLDTPENRKKIRAHSGCTVRELVQASQKGQLGVATYSYADFMYCKHLNKVPNNYLITLRRFPIPVLDSIAPVMTGKVRKTKNSGAHNNAAVPVGTMVTWMGVSGNDMKSILKYTYSMPFEEKTAQWEDIQKIGGGDNGILNGLEAAFNPAARKAYKSGQSVPALNNLMGSYFNVGEGPYGSPEENANRRDATKVYGPIDRVKSAYARSAEGLKFDQEFSLVFEYELKAYNGINPRQAMLDLLASILSVTYTTGGFWKGGYKGAGIRQSSFFQNMEIFKCHGSFTDYMDALSNDLRGPAQAFSDKMKSMSVGEMAKAALNMLNQVGGMLMGGLLNKLGRPAKYFANSLISDQPVGLWHITIGNPNHPIMVLGNMILTNTEIEHSGPLGIDDFPTNLKVTCTFKRGKPRDQYYIEAMYMGGEERIYHSMDKKLGDMYSAAQAYKSKNGAEQSMKAHAIGPKSETEIMASTQKKLESGASGGQSTESINAQLEGAYHQTVSSMRGYSDQWLYYFGMSDASNAITSARESDKGAFKAQPPAENTETTEQNGS